MKVVNKRTIDEASKKMIKRMSPARLQGCFDRDGEHLDRRSCSLCLGDDVTPEDAIKAKMRRGEQITPLDHVLTIRHPQELSAFRAGLVGKQSDHPRNSGRHLSAAERVGPLTVLPARAGEQPCLTAETSPQWRGCLSTGVVHSPKRPPGPFISPAARTSGFAALAVHRPATTHEGETMKRLATALALIPGASHSFASVIDGDCYLIDMGGYYNLSLACHGSHQAPASPLRSAIPAMAMMTAAPMMMVRTTTITIAVTAMAMTAATTTTRTTTGTATATRATARVAGATTTTTRQRPEALIFR